jgi:hypothetical protein
VKVPVQEVVNISGFNTIKLGGRMESSDIQRHERERQYKGVIEKTGMTIYMYGTHTISANGKSVALQSTAVNLDDYINKQVIVTGTMVEGYPVDDGPELMNVESVREE